MKYKIRHTTEYTYQEPVSTCLNRLCLTPLSLPEHHCISSEIKIEPTPDEMNYRTDFYGNTLLFFSTYKEHDHLEITALSEVTIDGRTNATLASGSMVLSKDVKSTLSQNPEENQDEIEFVLPSQYVPDSEVIKNFASDCFFQESTLWNSCQLLMGKIRNDIEFKPGFTTINTPVEAVVKGKKGVCQDFAHLMIACLRNMDIPARYVSGYIETLPPPGKKKLIGTDASHAWVSVYFPDIGWVEFDPTNNLLPSDKHITVAFGRDYHDVAPIKGVVFGSGKQTLDVKVDVERVDKTL
ncbi:MAG: transglutaminase family protein [Bacteroidia bacterium]|nr:transglutaminase family protein [Bacteroidia bacterium]